MTDSKKSGFSEGFPVRPIATELGWDDLVLDAEVMEQIRALASRFERPDPAVKGRGLSRRIRPGYRAFFYGPPGTGKTLTASLLGKHMGREVYRIDLSMVASKYIGETEKNLSRLFDRAEQEDWILFFDEADALFGKRTEVRDSHDRYANQEVSYLWQRIEAFGGFVIMAASGKAHLEAFRKRFDVVIEFPPRTRRRPA
jgi:SpoVK/Ycf46/Vps4 family AAA+-type ATPase